MKIKLKRKDLIKSLEHIKSIVDGKNQIPILSNIKLETINGDSLQITGTDLDITTSEIIECEIITGGATTINSNTFYEITKKLNPDSEIELELKEKQIKVKSDNAKFSLACLPVEDYPVTEKITPEATFFIEAKKLRSLLSTTQFAMSNEETRYYLQGIYLHPKDNKTLCAVATNGHRLAKSEISIEEEVSFEGIIIPSKTVLEIIKILSDFDTMKISISKSKIEISSKNINIISRLVYGTYPDYNRVIPSNNNNILEVSTKRLVKSIDMVSIISNDRIRSIKMEIEQNKLTVSSSSVEKGEARDILEAKYSSDNLTIGFNAKYILEALAEVEGEEATFSFKDELSPILIKDKDNEQNLFVVMPMRV